MKVYFIVTNSSIYYTVTTTFAMPDATLPPSAVDASIAAVGTNVASTETLVEGQDGYLDSVLERLCSLSDEAAAKEGKAKGNSIFKLATLKKTAKNLGLVCGQPKPDMILSLRAAVAKSKELKSIEATKREGTIDKILFLGLSIWFSAILMLCSGPLQYQQRRIL